MPMSNNVVALLISFLAGLATAVGGVAVQFKSLQTPEFLSLSMAVAAGVMLHVSYIETIKQSVDGFKVAWPLDPKAAMLASNIMFFIGVVVVVLLGKAVDYVQGVMIGVRIPKNPMPIDHHPQALTFGMVNEQRARRRSSTIVPEVLAMYMVSHSRDVDEYYQELLMPEESDTVKPKKSLTDADKSQLLHTSIVTAVAVCAHNLPGGIASFIALSSGTGNGLPLTVAIIIHNIPEGICVAVPILFATGSRLKAFLITLVAGLSKPLGAAIGWLLLRNIDPNSVNLLYGCFFGMVAGLMTYIALVELLPTAFTYYPTHPGRVSIAVFSGLIIMELSIIIIAFV